MAGSHVLKTKLTNEDNPTSQNTPPTQPTTTDNFEFPTLNIDGSVSDLIETHPPQGQRTPPAALSTLGLKMAHDTPTDNLTDLNDGQYDMVDDASDVSNDTNETVSIASDNLDSDNEDILTPEESDGVQDLDDLLEMPDHPSANGYSADPAHQQMFRRTRNLKRDFRKAHEEQAQAALQKEHESNEREKTLDSFLSEDLEGERPILLKKRLAVFAGDSVESESGLVSSAGNMMIPLVLAIGEASSYSTPLRLAV